MAKKNKVTNPIKSFLRSRYTTSVALALLLTVLNYYAIYFPWIISDQDIITQSTGYKKKLRKDDKQPNNLNSNRIAKDFLLIDVSNDQNIYCDTGMADTLGLPVDPGSLKTSPCYAGTDLGKLIKLFKWLSEHQNEYNLIVCDLLFDRLEKTKQTDSLLGYLINIVQKGRQSKIIFSGIYDKYNERFIPSYFSTHLPPESKGAVNEELTDNHLFKYKLSYNRGKIKSLPLLMLEKIDSYAVKSNRFWFDSYKRKDSSRIATDNVFIPEMLFPNEDFDLLKMPGNYNGASVDSTVGKMELWQTLLKFDDSNSYYLQEVLKTSSPKKRNIFIGSFNHEHTDIHKTLYGDMDGGAIILNIYYNLVFNQNKVDITYNLFIFAGFCIISWLVLHHIPNPYKGKSLILKIGIDIFFEELHYIILLLMTVLSSILFDKVSNVIVLLAVVFIINKIITAYKTNKGFSKKKTFQANAEKSS